ncbi:hypothetical protein [Halobacterium noricense]|uniref:hypothetical protein n=1 Tax=Halobacterium noricense TaxID=223182 RepID=UPI001E3A98B7|nr:hypothetical protein [Halobacterium noricense]UHH26130.1 hypothetical protein LT974_04155 [Halobacterium noricense]
MATRKLNTLLRDANYLLIFLPLANLLYVFSQTGAELELFLTCIAGLVCAYWLNYTVGIPDPAKTTSDNSDPGVFGVIYLFSLLLLAVAWIYSTYRIYEYTGASRIYANIFLIFSIGWPMLVSIHYLLDSYIGSVQIS